MHVSGLWTLKLPGNRLDRRARFHHLSGAVQNAVIRAVASDQNRSPAFEQIGQLAGLRMAPTRLGAQEYSPDLCVGLNRWEKSVR